MFPNKQVSSPLRYGARSIKLCSSAKACAPCGFGYCLCKNVRHAPGPAEGSGWTHPSSPMPFSTQSAFSTWLLGFFVVVVVLLLFFVSPAQPGLSPASGSGFDFNCLQLDPTCLCSHKGARLAERGEGGGAVKIQLLLTGSLLSCALTRLHHGWWTNFPCHEQTGCSLPAFCPFLIHCAMSRHLLHFILIQNHLYFNEGYHLLSYSSLQVYFWDRTAKNRANISPVEVPLT